MCRCKDLLRELTTQIQRMRAASGTSPFDAEKLDVARQAYCEHLCGKVPAAKLANAITAALDACAETGTRIVPSAADVLRAHRRIEFDEHQRTLAGKSHCKSCNNTGRIRVYNRSKHADEMRDCPFHA